MSALLEAFRQSKRLQIGVPAALALVVVAVLLVFVSPLGDAIGGSDTGESSASQQEQIVTVQLGTFSKQIPLDGKLSFPNKEALGFTTRGEIGAIHVIEGQLVQQGDALAGFDALAIAMLESLVAGERVNLQVARSALDALLIDNPLLIASAEAAVATARAQVDRAEEALDDLLAPDAIVIRVAEQTVADARIAVEDARESLEDLISPKEVDLAGAERRIAAAKVELDAAREAFEDIKDGAFPIEDIRDSQNAVTFAETNLLNAHRTLSETKLEGDNRLRAAQDLYDVASEDYRDIFKNWLGIVVTPDEMEQDPGVLFEQWNVDLDNLFNRNNPLYTTGTPTANKPETRWNELTIWAWLNLYPTPQRFIGNCDNNQVVVGRTCIQRQFEDLYDTFDIARDGLTTTQDTAVKSFKLAEDAVTAGEDALADAQESFKDIVVDGPELSAVEAAQTRLAAATAALAETKEDLQELISPDSLDVEQAERRLAVAESILSEALDDVDEILDPAPVDVDELAKALVVARATLAVSEVLVGSQRDLVKYQIEQERASLGVAQEILNDAMEDLEGVVLVAPFDGVVSLINVDLGDEVDEDSSVIELVDPTIVDVVGVVDAVNIDFIQEGFAASVEIGSIRGIQLTGEVIFIASDPVTENGVVSFQVTVRVNVPEGEDIPVGLSSVTTMIDIEQEGALLVPRGAVQSGLGGSVVQVMNGGSVEERDVVLGNRNNEWVVVESGLTEGEQVVVSVEAQTGSAQAARPPEG